MKFIVALRTCLFFEKSNCSVPYKSSFILAALSSEFKSWFFEFNNRFIVEKRISLCLAKFGQSNKKCSVDSTPVPHWHMSLGVSRKLWVFLWDLSWLSPTRSWYMYFKLSGSWILKMLCAWRGLIFSSIFFLEIRQSFKFQVCDILGLKCSKIWLSQDRKNEGI